MTHIFNVCLQCGSIIFGNLPLIFAAGVAIGLTNNDGVAALSAIVGYLIMNVTIGGILNVTPEMLETSRAYTSILGIPTLQTGVLGGIFIGVLASAIYNRFYKVELPQALAFFAGKRSVPIITAFAAFFLVSLCALYGLIQDASRVVCDNFQHELCCCGFHVRLCRTIDDSIRYESCMVADFLAAGW
ncbi:MAG: PTS transporter subunit EIIC [Clostridium sp.]